MPAPDADAPPNVVFIYTDDQDQERVNCYGGDAVGGVTPPLPDRLTPNIDRLAREGVRFDRFYVSSPVCVPSRYAALTGRYASRSPRLHEASPPGEPVNLGFQPGIYGDPHNVARVLSDAGYATGMVGKWHQGITESPHGGEERLVDIDPGVDGHDPDVARTMATNYETIVDAVESCGFDAARSVYRTNPNNLNVPRTMRHHNMDWVTQGAVEFIEAHQTEPFFLYVAPTLTHGPWGLEQLGTDSRSTPAGYLEEPPDVQPSRRDVLDRVRASGMIRGRRGDGFEVGADVAWLDDGVGAVLDRLDELGLAENTLVIFASDNGDLKGKGTCYERGARMPFIVRYPERVDPGATCDRLVSNVDIAPTIFDLAGVAPPSDYHIDGQSIRPLLTGEGTYERESVFLEVNFMRAVVTEEDKYIAVRHPEEIQDEIEAGALYSHRGDRVEFDHPGRFSDIDHPDYFDRDQLYDLTTDPDEQENLAGDPRYADRFEALREAMAAYSETLPHSFGEFTQ